MFKFKQISGVLSLALFLLGSSLLKAQSGEICYNPNLKKDTSKRSIKSAVVGVIGRDSVKINYHSPGVRGRVIWGGLVPYDEVWVTGAHDATTFEISKPLVIGGKVVAAGKYAIFTVPGRNEWTVIINSKWNQHLATEYDEKEDIVRLKVKPIRHAATERLQYFVEPGKDGSGKIAMVWEKIRIEFPVTLKK